MHLARFNDTNKSTASCMVGGIGIIIVLLPGIHRRSSGPAPSSVRPLGVAGSYLGDEGAGHEALP